MSKVREKKFSTEYDGGYTILRIPSVQGKLLKPQYRNHFFDMLSIPGLPMVRFYFQMWLISDADGGFLQAKVQKVGGANSDSARGGEWYEALRQREVSLIGNYLLANCFEIS